MKRGGRRGGWRPSPTAWHFPAALLLFLPLVALPSYDLSQAPEPFVLEEATIERIHEAMRSGDVDCLSLVEMYLARIEAYDKQGAAINAIITLNPRALRTAEELDAEFSRSGFTGPMHCIPVIVKDSYDTADMPTTAGSISLQGVVPPEDAFVVRRLRQAGAIILGKANLDEFSSGSTGLSSLGGQTRNPYALDHIPGGSSGGTGAAVASNFATVGMGEETGTSIRNPSTNNNLVGIAPTRGVVSRYGIVPISFTQDRAGPMTRTVADAAIVLDAIAGYDPRDLSTAWGVGAIPPSYTEFLRADGLQGARIGVVRELFGPDHTETSQLVSAAVSELKGQGAFIVDSVPFDSLLSETLPRFDPAYVHHYRGVEIDLVTVLSDARTNTYEFRTAINEYLNRPDYDAPIKSLTDLIESGEFLPRLEDRLPAYEQFASLNEEEYLERLMRHRALRNVVVKLMSDQDLDALVYPMKTEPAPRIGERAPAGNVLSSMTGFPAIVVPAGFTTESLPVSVEFLGRPFSEPTLIKLAYSYEQATMHRRPPASVPPLVR